MRYRDATARARSAGGCGREVPLAPWRGILAHGETAVSDSTRKGPRGHGAPGAIRSGGAGPGTGGRG